MSSNIVCIADKDKITRLPTVPVDCRRLLSVQRSDETGDCSSVSRGGILARPVDIKEAQRYRFEPVEPSVQLAKLLSSQLSRGIRREWR